MINACVGEGNAADAAGLDRVGGPGGSHPGSRSHCESYGQRSKQLYLIRLNRDLWNRVSQACHTADTH